MVYKWENGGGLKHHCGVCNKQLSRASAKATCLVKHGQPCHRFHHYIHFVDQSHGYESCKRNDSAHEKRHTEIVAILKELENMDSLSVNLTNVADTEEGVIAPAQTPDRSPACPIKDRAPIRKRDRKAAKKIAKAAARQKVTPAMDVLRLHEILHPAISQAVNISAALEEDETEANNDNTASTDDPLESILGGSECQRSRRKLHQDVDPKELSRITAALGLPKTSGKTPHHIAHAVADIERRIKDDLESSRQEQVDTEIRKRSFFAYAGRPAYEAIMERNGARVWETGEILRDAAEEDELVQGDGEEV